MFLLVLILNKTELLEQVLQSLVQAGVPGATIFDSTGMGRALAQSNHDSILAGIRTIFEYTRPHNKTIISVVNSPEQKESAIRSIKSVVGDMSKPGVGILFTSPLADVVGLNGNQ